ncbi:unnamed protein product [Mytilus coruscus]|uniref:C1q domain-containing protein n=1 Tax=Mytilus coruscus TaxID=42192 RepID=A0A6J8BJJ8_MYTCO|nr:unnamed protein product [Mytilus coruscus]
MTEEGECTGPNCELIISMPLLDNMEATLKADLDVRKLNIFLQSFIRQVVKKEVEDVMREDMMKIMNESVSNVENLFKDRTNEIKLGLDSEFDKLKKKIMNESVSNVENLFNRTNEMKLRIDSKFDKLMKKKEMQGEENKVALTAQLTSGKASYGILKFDNVIFSVGYNNLPAYKSTGKFVCEKTGLYLIFASISSSKNNAYYNLYLNNNVITSTYINYDSNSPSTTWSTGTIVLTLHLRHSDSVWVNNGPTSIYTGKWSTLTIVKVK